MHFISSWVRDINVKQSTELGTGNFRKPRRSSVMPPELMILKYREIIKTKDDLERKSLIGLDLLSRGKPSYFDDEFDFSPSIPKKTKHHSLMINAKKQTNLKKNLGWFWFVVQLAVEKLPLSIQRLWVLTKTENIML